MNHPTDQTKKFVRISELSGGSLIDYKNQFSRVVPEKQSQIEVVSGVSSDEEGGGGLLLGIPNVVSSKKTSSSKISKTTKTTLALDVSRNKVSLASSSSKKAASKQRTSTKKNVSVSPSDRLRWMTENGRRVLWYNGKKLRGFKAFSIWEEYKSVQEKSGDGNPKQGSSKNKKRKNSQNDDTKGKKKRVDKKTKTVELDSDSDYVPDYDSA